MYTCPLFLRFYNTLPRSESRRENHFNWFCDVGTYPSTNKIFVNYFILKSQQWYISKWLYIYIYYTYSSSFRLLISFYFVHKSYICQEKNPNFNQFVVVDVSTIYMSSLRKYIAWFCYRATKLANSKSFYWILKNMFQSSCAKTLNFSNILQGVCTFALHRIA